MAEASSNSKNHLAPRSARALTLRGVRVRNLKGVDVDIPSNSLVVITGVSGAGKTSLAIDTLAAEGQRRFMETFPVSARRFLERLERPDTDHIGPLPPAIILRRSHGRPSRRTTVATLAEVSQSVQQLYAESGTIICPDCHLPVVAHSAASIAAVIATWPEGIRFQIGFRRDLEPSETPDVVASELMEAGFQRVIVDGRSCTLKVPLPADWPAARKWLVVVDRLQTGRLTVERLHDSLEQSLQRGGGSCLVIAHDTDHVVGRQMDVDGAAATGIWFYTSLRCGGCGREFPLPSPRLFSITSPHGTCPRCRGVGEVANETCPACRGQRLNANALAVHFNGLSVGQLLQQTVDEAAKTCADWLQAASFGANLDGCVRWLQQLQERLSLMQRLGLGYLSLNRAGRSLSSGEVQRLSLAAVCAVKLVASMYVLDEPAAGLHPLEINELLAILREIQGRRNSVIVVEHAAAVIRAADYVIDLGPGAGPDGGQVIYQGSPGDLLQDANSQTAGYLIGRLKIERRRRPESSGLLQLKDLSHRCLNGIDVELPLGTLCVVTGVSGSGKSTLVADTIYPLVCQELGQPSVKDETWSVSNFRGAESLKSVVYVDQSPPEKSTRSNVATASSLWAEIRAILAATPEAKVRQFTAGTFSFHNAQGGRCTACEGLGTLAVDLQFLADLQVTCPDCHGTRFQREVLEVKYRGLSVADILNLTVNEALPFFRGRSRLQRRVKALKDVGLSYLQLGQPISSLSGGETQRLQLATQMTARPVGPTLYLLDEPARGLHPANIQNLVNWFDDLLDQGHSLIVIEHRPELIAVADHVVELQPAQAASARQF